MIIALKNICYQKMTAAPEVTQILQSVQSTGRTVRSTSLSDRRRKELGLDEMKIVPMDELKVLFEPEEE